MLSLISLGKATWAKLQAAHPVIRWGGAILVAIVALEFVGQEAISLYTHLATVRATIEKQNADASRAANEAELKRQATAIQTRPGELSADEQQQLYCSDDPAIANNPGVQKLRQLYGRQHPCSR